TWLQPDLPRASTQLTLSLRGLGRLDAQQEREIIEAALADSQGRIAGPSGAAAKLRLPRQTLESKIASLGINKHSFKSGDRRRQAQVSSTGRPLLSRPPPSPRQSFVPGP